MSVPCNARPETIDRDIESLVASYAKSPNTIMLALLSANNDIANAEALSFCKKIDPEGQRTIGVMTKIDLYEGSTENLSRILSNEVVKLRLGFVCTSTLDFEEDASLVNGLKDKLGCLDQSNFGRKCLVNKLEQVLLMKMSANLQKIKMFLSEELAEIEKQSMDTLICSNVKTMNSDSKSMLLLKLINTYTDRVKQHLRGNHFEIDQELRGEAVINDILDRKFKQQVAMVQVEQSINYRNIYMTIMNTNGFQSSLFVSQKAFEILVRHLIKKLLPLSIECLNLVWTELKRVFESVWIGDPDYFFNLRREILATIDALIFERMLPAKTMIEQFFEIEAGHINTKHPDFLLTAKESIMHSVKESRKRSRSTYQEDQSQSEKPERHVKKDASDRQKKPEAQRKGSEFDIMKLTKREKNEIELIMDMLHNYFKLVKKNVCDYVPKIVITLLVKKTISDCERVLISKLYKEEKYDVLFQMKTEHENKLMRMKDKIADIKRISQLLAKL